jgi:hypothetical protein
VRVGRLAFPALALMSASASAREPDCSGDLCGHTLLRQGWSASASCNDGHTWSYLISKDGRTLMCRGINARGGPRETPCSAFDGDADAFRAWASMPSEKLGGAGCSGYEGRS